MIEMLATLFAKEALNPEVFANLFKEGLAPDRLFPQIRDTLTVDPERSSQLRHTILSGNPVEMETIRDSIIKDVVHDKLAPFVEDPQRDSSLKLPDGSTTRIDFMAVAKQDIGFSAHLPDVVKKGEKFSVEVKTGGENYLHEQFKPGGHIETQIAGHDWKSIIFVSKDFKDIPLDAQQEIRSRMRDKNVVIVADLPEKSSLDKCCQRAAGQVEPQKTERQPKEQINKNGPEDQAFEKGFKESAEKRGNTIHAEEELQRNGPGWKSRPDGYEVSSDGKTIYVNETKRPSEMVHKSWRSTYDGDPIREKRVQAVNDYKSGEITKERANAKIIVAEHDDHWDKRGKTWNFPEWTNSEGKEVKHQIAVPGDIRSEGFINETRNELQEQGRNPEVIRDNGVVRIIYDPRPVKQS